MKPICFDLDGVLFRFEYGAGPIINDIAASKGLPRYIPDAIIHGEIEPPVWDWPEHYAALAGVEASLAKQVDREMWSRINRSTMFWYNLPATRDMEVLVDHFGALEGQHDIYFCTSRSGRECKAQTENALLRYLPYTSDLGPTVLITKHKGHAAYALNAGTFIDDKRENIIDIRINSRDTRVYVLDKPYNREGGYPPHVHRVQSLAEFFEAEAANLFT